MTYSLCAMGGAPGCPAAELCEAKRLTMWKAMETAKTVSGAERTDAVRDAIEIALQESPAVDSYTQSEVARLAMATMHIAADHCERDKVSYYKSTTER